MEVAQFRTRNTSKKHFGIHIFVWFQQHFTLEYHRNGTKIFQFFVTLPLMEEATNINHVAVNKCSIFPRAKINI